MCVDGGEGGGVGVAEEGLDGGDGLRVGFGLGRVGDEDVGFAEGGAPGGGGVGGGREGEGGGGGGGWGEEAVGGGVRFVLDEEEEGGGKTHVPARVPGAFAQKVKGMSRGEGE